MNNDDCQGIICPDPPDSPKIPVTDCMHGHTIDDPYRWLEDASDPGTTAWIEKHTERTGRIMDQIPYREAVEEDIKEVISQDAVGHPRVAGGVLFYTLQNADDEQPHLRALRDGRIEVLIDPNLHDTPTSLDWWYPSPDGSRIVFGLSENGDEWSTLQILDIESGEIFPEEVERARWATVAWQPDGSAFHYTRCMYSHEIEREDEIDHRRVFYHRIGDDPAEDPLVYGHRRPTEEMYEIKNCLQDDYAMLMVNRGWKATDIYINRRSEGIDQFSPLLEGEDALFTGDIVDDTAVLLTNLDAPRYRVVAVDVSDDPDYALREIIPEHDDLTLTDILLTGDRLVVSALRDAVSRLYTCDLGGADWTEVELPFEGTVSNMVTGTEDVYFVLQSYTRPPAIYRLDMAGPQIEEVVSSSQVFEPDEFVVKQEFYSSEDGTRVPMTIMHHRDTDVSKPRPAVLTAYGGFSISRTPVYSPVPALWARAGGVYAVANIRGGGEYGGTWHRAATMGNRQKAYDDFIAAAEHLVDAGYTDSGRLGVVGASNGGLLVGAFMTQRPRLARAVVCGVPVLDMIRYHRFGIGPTGIHEYGSAEIPEHFEWLYQYSPYHRVRDGTQYPAVYLYTALADSRVPPLHALKMTARLIEASNSDLPIILHVEAGAGHGAGKTRSQEMRGHLRIWLFLSWQLGLRWR